MSDLLSCILYIRRIEFSKEDDEFLVKYIAEIIPEEETGGRLGNNLYIDLENNVCLKIYPQKLLVLILMVHIPFPSSVFLSQLVRTISNPIILTIKPEKYPWSKRHSWHSWRNRYKIRQLIFDIAIRDYVKAHRELLEQDHRRRGDGNSAGGDSGSESGSGSGAAGTRRLYRRGPGSGALVRSKGAAKAKATTKSKAKVNGTAKAGPKTKKKTKKRQSSTSDEDEVGPDSQSDTDAEPDREPSTTQRKRTGIASRTRKRRRLNDSGADDDNDVDGADGDGAEADNGEGGGNTTPMEGVEHEDRTNSSSAGLPGVAR